MAGPVHLNAPFRDPLPPVEDATTAELRETLNESAFFGGVQPPVRVMALLESVDFPAARRGLIIAGPSEDSLSPVEVGIMAGFARETGWPVHVRVHPDRRRSGWPVLADGLSGLRGDAPHFPNLVTRYDAIVRSAAAAQRLQPEMVLCVGGWPTSKSLRAWLEKCAPEVWLVTSRAQNLDALHLLTRHFRGGLRAFVGSVVVGGRGAGDYADAWRHADQAAGRSIDRVLGRAKGMFEGRATLELARNLPKLTPMFVANSMPVRDVEYFWPANDRAVQLYFNRGANGIDGTLSTALGIAHEHRPAVALVGDLALLHDANGFLLAPKFRGSLTIVLINNAGGGIFEHLPVAQFNPPFEEFFATPQRVEFQKLCAAHGVGYIRVRDWKHFAGLISRLPKSGIRVLELRTDRKRDAALRKKMFADAALAAEKALK